ncbi:hypothetical protein [Actinoplanes sp. NPDC051859]|uniref:hypothetical protein n=1 Tax=Actinoplanes sp. NPDC051859 TaxID=3363909 RepID=UPI00379D6488
MNILRAALALSTIAALAACTDSAPAATPDAQPSASVDTKTALTASTEALAVGNYHFTGTIEGSRMLPTLSSSGLPMSILGQAPFTAQLDAEDASPGSFWTSRLTETPESPALTWTLNIDGYGASQAPQAPAKFTELPEDVYEAAGAKPVQRLQGSPA